MRRNNNRNRYTTEYVSVPRRPDLARVTAEPTKTIYINMTAAPWATSEYTIKHGDDPLLLKLAKGA